MRHIAWTAALLVLLPAAAPADEKAPPPAAPAPTPAKDDGLCWDFLCGEPCYPVTFGDPDQNPALWQRTWGIAAFDAFPTGQKMAPNGVPYDPMFSLDLLLNIALCRDREWYLFVKSRFWAQKPGEGITNSKQGVFDFSKRQFDLDGGVAWNFYGRLEGRAYFYSYNNLNRGENLWQPKGYKDGFAVECRYYLPSTDFDKGLYRFLALGYYPTKELVGADGDRFKPSLFATAHVAYDFVPERFYVYADLEFITERPLEPKLLIADPGIAVRPFNSCQDLEFRVGAESTIDLQLGFTRTLLYATARIVW